MSEWIPCSERLPEKTQRYLVTERNVYGEIEVVTCYYNYNGHGGFWSGLGKTPVIAWMPLPEPYNGDRK